MSDILVECKTSIDCFTTTISVESKIDENITYVLTGRLCALVKNRKSLKWFLMSGFDVYLYTLGNTTSRI